MLYYEFIHAAACHVYNLSSRVAHIDQVSIKETVGTWKTA